MEQLDYLHSDESVSQTDTEIEQHATQPSLPVDEVATNHWQSPPELTEAGETASMSQPVDASSNQSESLAMAPEPISEHEQPVSAALPPNIPEVATPPVQRLAMPQLYIKTNGLRPRGILPGDDLQIEVLLPEKEPSRTRIWFSEIRALVRDFLFAAITALVIVVFVIQPVKVEGTSMLPRLHDGERIFVNKFIYQFEPIQRGDIVVFWYPKNPSQSFIKRVIGLPGDEIRMSNGKLYINNKLVPEPYLSPEFTSNVMPNRYWVVEEHHYFVMGDNRDASNDSRSWGQVPEKYIYGKAIFRYWPLDHAGSLTD